jgi:hypothetical protein
MKNKKFLWIGTLALSAVVWAGPKAYSVVFSEQVKAGDVALPPGEYKVKVDGSNATFTDTKTRKSTTVPVKVESADKKFESTLLDTEKQGDMPRLNSIRLGGSNTMLQFGK